MNERNPFFPSPQDDTPSGWNTLFDAISGVVIVAAIVVAMAWMTELVR